MINLLLFADTSDQLQPHQEQTFVTNKFGKAFWVRDHY